LRQLRRRQPSRFQLSLRGGLVLVALGASAPGCGEDVLVVNWELRSLTDAGPFDEADAGGGNDQSDYAEQARDAAERERNKREHDRASNDGKRH
jgi:hypothetical protein